MFCWRNTDTRAQKDAKWDTKLPVLDRPERLDSLLCPHPPLTFHHPSTCSPHRWPFRNLITPSRFPLKSLWTCGTLCLERPFPRPSLTELLPVQESVSTPSKVVPHPVAPAYHPVYSLHVIYHPLNLPVIFLVSPTPQQNNKTQGLYSAVYSAPRIVPPQTTGA